MVESRPLVMNDLNKRKLETTNSNRARKAIHKSFSYKNRSSVLVQVQDISSISKSLFTKFEPLRRQYRGKCPMTERTYSGRDDRSIPSWVKSVACNHCSSTCVPVQVSVPFLKHSSHCLGFKRECFKLKFKSITVAYYVSKPF